MDVKKLEEANEAIAMLKELDLPISMEQLGQRKILETEYLRENVIPQIQSYIQSLVGNLHKSFCLVVDYEYGSPVEVRIAEKTKKIDDIIQGGRKTETTQSRVISSAYNSERVQSEWSEFLKTLPSGNPIYKFTFTQSYSSLSKLLRIMQSDEMIKYTSSLFEKLNLPTNGKLTPTGFKNMLEPEQLEKEMTKDGPFDRIVLWSQTQKVEKRWDGTRTKVFKADGITPVMVDKTKKIKEGQWSLKTLCSLMVQKEYFANKRSIK